MFTALAQKAPSAKPFERFDGCVLEPDEWTDGDSFRVRLPDGRLESFEWFCRRRALSAYSRHDGEAEGGAEKEGSHADKKGPGRLPCTYLVRMEG